MPAIKQLDVFPLAYPEPNDAMSTRYVVVVRLETDNGIVGWGECVSIFCENTAAVTALIRQGLADEVIGQDPLDVEALWSAMKQRVWWYGDVGGVAAFAISALDMAVWDVRGKLLHQSLSEMLGGARQTRLPACASSHPSAPTIDGMARELAGHIDMGFQMVKVGFAKKGEANLGTDAERDIAFAKAVRAAIGDAGFMIDVGAKLRWSVPYAIQMAQAFRDVNLMWLEDPFHPDNLAGYQRLRAAVPELMIAFGERFFTLDGYHRLLQAQVCDVILVDPGRAEGVTGMQRIIQLATRYNVSMDAHSWSTAINAAAALHLSLCAERPTIFELKPRENPMMHDLARNPITQVEGWVVAPEGAGLGVDVNEDTVRKYTVSF
ncbi:MAG: D-galactarolactone cycloisomerase [Anaerolineae bacterium]